MQSMRTPKLVLLAIVYGLVGGIWSLGEAYEAVQVQNGGVISGVVKFAGPVPPLEQLAITKDQATCGTGQRPSEALLVAADQGIKNVVVSLVDVSKGKPQPAAPEPPTLTQEKCWFSPRVLLVPAESTIDVLNHDNVMHNIHTASQANPVVNKAHPTFKKKLSFALRKPETIKVKCDIHPWMSAWFVVTEHPYYTVTEANGSFTLTDVPPGTYTLQAWHETLGKQTQQVSVSANGASKVVFELKP
jgi:plastocyanin